jgi:hypothetical protein
LNSAETLHVVHFPSNYSTVQYVKIPYAENKVEHKMNLVWIGHKEKKIYFSVENPQCKHCQFPNKKISLVLLRPAVEQHGAKQAIINLFHAGEPIPEISRKLGVPKTTIYYPVLRIRTNFDWIRIRLSKTSGSGSESGSGSGS